MLYILHYYVIYNIHYYISYIKIITDVDFADDIALISEDMDKANEFLLRVESAAASVGRRTLHVGGSVEGGSGCCCGWCLQRW